MRHSPLLQNGDRRYLQVGLKRRSAFYQPEWLDGTPLDYQNWMLNEPGNDTAKACTAIEINGQDEDAQWMAVECDNNTDSFICKIDPLDWIQEDTRCPLGYSFFPVNARCYIVSIFFFFFL